MLLAAFVLQASAATFAPPLDTPLRVTTERIEKGRRYAAERLVRFLAEPGGYRAEVRMRSAASDTQDLTGALYEAGFGALAGRLLVFHLDSAGAVIAIDDMAALWEAFCRRVGEVAAQRKSLAAPDAAKLAERIAAPLRAMPVERQRAMLASWITALIAPEAREPAGERPVRVPGVSPFGGAVTLEGTRSVTRFPRGLRGVTRASADVAQGERAGHIDYELIEDLDPETGLLIESRLIQKTRAGTVETMRITTLKVERAASAD